MSIPPIEVVVRAPRRTAPTTLGALIGSALAIALDALIVFLLLPIATALVGIDAHPNYGTALAVVLLARVLGRRPSTLPHLSASEQQRESK